MKKEERENKLKEILNIYKEQNISISQLSEQFNISAVTISRYLNKHNIDIKKVNGTSKLKSALQMLSIKSVEEVTKEFEISEEVLRIYNSGLSKTEFKTKVIDMAVDEYINTQIYDRSITKISLKYGINKKTLTKYLKERNIPIISNRNKTNFNETFFDVIDTEEKAYWLGFMYADGYIAASDNAVGLDISLKDIDHLKKYNKALSYTKGLNIKETHQFGSKLHTNSNGEIMYMVSTVIRNSHLWEALNSKGCVPNKSLILTFPNENIFTSKKLIYDFIRGYVDGDGSFGVYRHSKTNPNLEESLNIVGTKLFLEGVQKYLGKGFLMHKTNCNENTYRLNYSTKKAYNAVDMLYKNANIYLERKYNIYINNFLPRQNRVNSVKLD